MRRIRGLGKRRTKWEAGTIEEVKTGEQETQNEELYRAFDGERRDKKMYFSCFLCCPPSPVGNIPLLSPSLLPSFSVWHSGKIGRNPNRARHTGCSLLTLTGGGCSLQSLLTSPAETSPIGRSGHQSGTAARRRLGEMGWEGRGCGSVILNGFLYGRKKKCGYC